MLIFLTIYILNICLNKKIMKHEGKIIFLIFMTIIIGISGNFISDFERPYSLIISGIIVWFKSFIVFICANRYFSKFYSGTNGIIKKTAKVVRLIVLCAFIGLILSPITKFGVDTLSVRMRYGLHPYKFLYSQPALLSWYCIAFAMILMLDLAFNTNKKKNIIYLILNSIVWAFTLRSRAFAFIISFWILYFIIFKLERFPKIKFKYIAITGIIVFLVGGSAIQKYFMSGETTRAILLFTGIDIAKKYFPLGVGFANYATSASFKAYSPVYYLYGFNNIYRLNQSEDGMTELTDCYWPAVMGELGVLGVIFIVAILFKIGKYLINKSKKNKYSYSCTIFLIVTSLFSSIATGVYSSDAMILYVIITCIGCYMNIGNIKGLKNNG